MESLGFQVNRLIRVSYGPFQLGELKAGEVEEVRAKVLRDQVGAMLGKDAPKAGEGHAAQKAPRKAISRRVKRQRPG